MHHSGSLGAQKESVTLARTPKKEHVALATEKAKELSQELAVAA